MDFKFYTRKKQMKILIIGLPYFAQKLQKELSSYDKDNAYIFLNTHYKKTDKIKYLLHLINTDIIYIHGGLICCSELIDIALKFNKRIIMNWAGSDVLKAKEILYKKNYNYINNIEHYCVAPWLQEELKDININAKLLDITVAPNYKKKLSKTFKELSVLSYISKDKPMFYGIDIIIKLANYFPNIKFRIAGIKHHNEIPTNLTLLGWIDMEEEYIKNPIFIRTPKHDGMPFSVIEALSYGRVVFYNHKVPFVNYFQNFEDLKNQFQKVVDDFEQGKLTINYEAIEYVKKEFNKEKILNNLIKVFNEK